MRPLCFPGDALNLLPLPANLSSGSLALTPPPPPANFPTFSKLSHLQVPFNSSNWRREKPRHFHTLISTALATAYL